MGGGRVAGGAGGRVRLRAGAAAPAQPAPLPRHAARAAARRACVPPTAALRCKNVSSEES